MTFVESICVWGDKSGIAQKKEILLSLVAFLLLAFALYADTFGYQWAYDDIKVVVENPDIRSLGSFFKDTYPGRPLRELTFLLDYSLFGLDPHWYHFQNIFWHGINAALLFFLVIGFKQRRTIAVVSALFFLVHPLCVGVVATTSHRKDSLALVFSLLALLCIQKFYAGVRVRRWANLIFFAVCYALAIMSKQSAWLLPLAVILYELAFLERSCRVFIRFNPKWLLFFVLLSIGSYFCWLFWGGGDVLLIDRAYGVLFYKIGIAEKLSDGQFYPLDMLRSEGITYLLLVMKSWAFMLGKFFMPSMLAVEYAYPVPATFYDSWILLCLGFIALFLLLSFYGWKKDRLTLFLVTLAALFWLPTANIWPLSYHAADRYMYPMVACLSVIVVRMFFMAITQVTIPWKNIVSAVLLCVLVVMSVLSLQQMKTWENSLTLWQRAVEVSPTSRLALLFLGDAFEKKHDYANAEYYFLKVRELYPNDLEGKYQLMEMQMLRQMKRQ